MSFRPRIKLLAACVGAALAQLGAGSSFADSAVGVDTALGNALNPPGRSAVPRPIADDGYDTVRHSPSGQLYGQPADASDDSTQTESGWAYKGSVEAGLLGGDANKKSSLYRQYMDLKNGPYLNYFAVEADKPDSANYVQAFGGGTGRDDQFYGLQFGRYNDWKVKTFYNETPHVFSSDFKRIYNSDGNGHLTLPAGTAGVGTAANLGTTLLGTAKALPDSEIGLVRKKGGVRLDMNLAADWKGYVSVTQEKREGERPFAIMGVEGEEPIDYKTTDLLAGLQYTDKLTAVNLRASASLFRNDIHTMYAQSAIAPAAGSATNVAGLSTFVYSLPPDNQAYNLKGEVSRKLPDFYNGRVSGSLAWGSSRQNDAIRMPLDPGLVPNGTTVGLTTAANWNGTNGSPLTRTDSGQRIDSKLLNLSLALNPLDDLNLKGTVRHYATQNKSGAYYSYNPLTGEWFNGLFNSVNGFGTATPSTTGAGGLGRCQPAPGFPVVAGCTSAATSSFTSYGLMAPPRDNKQTNYTLSADYDLGKASTLEGTVEREDFSHTFRERDKTWEDKFTLGYVNRSLGDTTLRTSLEHDSKRGSFYDPAAITRDIGGWFSVYGVTYNRAALQNLIANAGTGIYPALATIQAALLSSNHNSGGWMRPDQADRDQNILNARLNYMARQDLDLGVMAQFKKIKYPGNSFGPQKDDSLSLNFDLNFQPANGTRVTAFYSRQDGKQQQIDNYGAFAGSGYASLLAYTQSQCGPALTVNNIDCYLSNTRIPGADITVDTKNTNDVVGLGLTHEFGSMTLSANYSYSRGITHIVHAYGAISLTAAQQTAEAQYGDYPDITLVQNTLDLNLLVPIDKRTTVRLLYRFDGIKVRDWHYDYYNNMTITTFAPADYGPQNYHANIIGAFIQYKF
ncbi:MAG: MtrB/PioB family outer membrane beta-barrel protein [Rhodocyclaceae bacterium]|nr:MtrB/PioB family outer membrane beta-barrel protein [Rhodocyclaceae bacterium]